MSGKTFCHNFDFNANIFQTCVTFYKSIVFWNETEKNFCRKSQCTIFCQIAVFLAKSSVTRHFADYLCEKCYICHKEVVWWGLLLKWYFYFSAQLPFLFFLINYLGQYCVFAEKKMRTDRFCSVFLKYLTKAYFYNKLKINQLQKRKKKTILEKTDLEEHL